MPVIKPFKALHPTEKNVGFFPSGQIENYSKEEIQEKTNTHQPSIFNIVEPTFGAQENTKTNYQKVRANFLSSLEKEIIVQDEKVSFYIYQQQTQQHNYTGIIGLFDMKDVPVRNIRLHENTLEKRKKLFADYLSEVHIQSEPVLLSYPQNTKVDVLIEKEMKNKPLLSFQDENQIWHKIWKVDNRIKQVNFVDSFKKMEAIYIADGHHRLGSTQMYAEQQKKADRNSIGTEPYNYVLGFIVNDKSLKIHEYNRLIKDLNGLSTQEFLEKLSANFTIVSKGNKPYFPSHKHHISMYIDGTFYGLYIKHELRGTPKGLGELDTYLFEQLLAKPILNIEDSTKDSRIYFLKGSSNITSITHMQEKVDSGAYKVAFGFYPISFQDLKLISDLELKMPPKSTYIEPKLLTGLIMYNMEE